MAVYKLSNKIKIKIKKLIMPILMLMPMLKSYRLAEKYYMKHVYQAMEEQYKEIGMNSISVVCYSWIDGKLAVDM